MKTTQAYTAKKTGVRLCIALMSLLGLLACAVSPVSSGTLAMLDEPINADHAEVLAHASRQWQSEAQCETMKTGVGKNRRSYLMETCRFENASGTRIHDEAPVRASYVFIDQKLIQIEYEFDQIDNQQALELGLQEDAKVLATRMQDEQTIRRWTLSQTAPLRISMSRESLVSQVHALQGTR